MLDAIAFDRAYRELNPKLVAYMREVTKNSADAEDMAQSAWIEAWRHRCKLRVDGLIAWLRQVARRFWWHKLSPIRQNLDGVMRRVKAPEILGEDHIPEDAIIGEQENAVVSRELSEAIDNLMIVNPRYPEKPQPAPDSTKETMRLARTHEYASGIAKVRGVATTVVDRALASGIAAIRRAWRLE